MTGKNWKLKIIIISLSFNLITLKYIDYPGFETIFVFITDGPPWIYNTVEQLYIIYAYESIFVFISFVLPLISNYYIGSELETPWIVTGSWIYIIAGFDNKIWLLRCLSDAVILKLGFY